MFIVWMIIFAATFIIEMFTVSLVSIWFSVGALVAILLEYSGLMFSTQIIGFIITSGLTFLVFRPALMKHIKTPKIRTNIDSIIGKTGEVVKDITPLSYGQVKVSGQIWTAKSLDDRDIKSGTLVEVVQIEGVKLIVKKMKGGNVQCSGSS
ncbi:NfeD family protein [Clostridium sp. Cult3]|uniref:NfeD family protein n=1 Tax=Clostridium sp. Cult3 TaxID=2079004 RepID=UPI001F2C0D0D|nr:NfeD family protein [Clostridium sp. Cult3]MCF6461146.1 NfeD family protein [Clostridium sp. Cult3]